MVVVPELAASRDEEAEFWQLLLSAELPFSKSRAILESLGSSRIRRDLEDSRLLTAADRQRMDLADMTALHVALESGVRLTLPAGYPPLLEMADAPPALFTWGPTDALFKPTVAIVGTRGASAYGKAAATKFAESLVRAGVTIVSGGAIGVDAAAHRGALDAGGKTVAVLAGGVDRLYPAMHKGLFASIREQGCLISQFAIGSRPDRYKFLARNDLIAALSNAVIVIEAPQPSGSLRTAHAANDLGRQVFVVPATIDMVSFAGSHALIRDGATLVDHPDQVLEALNIKLAEAVSTPQVASAIGERILAVMSISPLSPEKIAELANLEPAEVLAELTMLEIEGHAIRTAGGFIRKL